MLETVSVQSQSWHSLGETLVMVPPACCPFVPRAPAQALGSTHGEAALHQVCFQWDRQIQVIWENQMRLSVFLSSQLFAEGHMYGLGCLLYPGAPMDTASLIFQGFLPSSGGSAYFLASVTT